MVDVRRAAGVALALALGPRLLARRGGHRYRHNALERHGLLLALGERLRSLSR